MRLPVPIHEAAEAEIQEAAEFYDVEICDYHER